MKKLAAIIVLMMTASAMAQEAATESNTNTMSVNTGSNSTKKDIDEEITNAKLRAVTGSKKNISVSSSFSYVGGPLNHPTSTERPQLNAQAAADPAKLSGQIATKWRVSDHDNLSLGFGVDFTPEHKDAKTGDLLPAKTNASTPYLSYGRVFKAGGIQNVLDASVSKYTAQEDLNEKLNGELNLSHTMMGSVLNPKLEIGLSTYFSQEIYSQSPSTIQMYQVALNPILEYAFTDKLSFRTVYRWLTYTSLTDEKNTYKLGKQTESMGLGYAVTRDVYIYPNMQWSWSAISADKTTVGVAANINL